MTGTVCSKTVRCANCGAKGEDRTACADWCPHFSPARCWGVIREGVSHSHMAQPPYPYGNAVSSGAVVLSNNWPAHWLKPEDGDRGACRRCGRMVNPPKGGDFSHSIYCHEKERATCLL